MNSTVDAWNNKLSLYSRQDSLWLLTIRSLYQVSYTICILKLEQVQFGSKLK
jgi:hypothetical protein